MSKVIILNAPAGAGKDTIADLITQQYGYMKLQFKEELYKELAGFYDLPIEVIVDVCSDREKKEAPCDYFGGLTPRQALIMMSEDIVKPQKGKRYFGEQLAKEAHNFPFVIVSDGGFHEEVQAVQDEHQCIVVRLNGRGTFKGDSRKYLNQQHLKRGTVFDVQLVDDRPDLAVQAIMQLTFPE